MLIIYGDLHLDDSTKYFYAVSKRVVDYLIKDKYNTPENSVLFLGDITSSNKLTGRCISLLENLFSNLKYKNIYILQGNHEGRIVNGKEVVLSYEFLEQRCPNLSIIKEFGEYTLDGFSVLAFPHIYPVNLRSNKWYERITDEEQCQLILNKKYDIAVGHITKESIDFYSLDKIKLPEYSASVEAFGHIHSAAYESYLGSLYACSVSENDAPRYKLIVDKTATGEIRSVKENLPVFLKYKEIALGDALEENTDTIFVYTIKNCVDESEAFNLYKKDLFIKQCIYSATGEEGQEESKEADMYENGITKELLDNFVTQFPAYKDVYNNLFSLFALTTRER